MLWALEQERWIDIAVHMRWGDYTLVESLLQAVTLENHLRDVRFELELGVMNVGDEARLPPGGRLRVTCKDFVAMRAGREPWQALRQDPRDAVGWMQDGRKTVVGFGREDPAESDLLREIGPRERELHHLVLSTTDAVFDVAWRLPPASSGVLDAQFC